MTRLRRLAALLTAGAFGAVVTATPAVAVATTDEAALVTCPGYATQQFEPGMVLLPRDIAFHAEGTFGPCVSTSPQYAFADYDAQGQALLSCSVSLPVNGVSGSLRWHDASGSPTGVSTFTGGISLTQRPIGQNVVVVVATIASGPFAGNQLTYTIALLNTQLNACLTTGITQVAGPAALTVLPI